jgi:membrane protein implicated in regulation of membrane protease activity
MSDLFDAKLCDVGNLILGAILIFCAWMFGFSTGPQSENAFVAGIVLVAVSIVALTAFAAWEEWLNLAAGLWLVVSPWLLGFRSIEAMRVEFTIGVVVAAFAWNELWFRSHLKLGPPSQQRSESGPTLRVHAPEHHPKVPG